MLPKPVGHCRCAHQRQGALPQSAHAGEGEEEHDGTVDQRAKRQDQREQQADVDADAPVAHGVYPPANPGQAQRGDEGARAIQSADRRAVQPEVFNEEIHEQRDGKTLPGRAANRPDQGDQPDHPAVKEWAGCDQPALGPARSLSIAARIRSPRLLIDSQDYRSQSLN